MLRFSSSSSSSYYYYYLLLLLLRPLLLQPVLPLLLLMLLLVLLLLFMLLFMYPRQMTTITNSKRAQTRHAHEDNTAAVTLAVRCFQRGVPGFRGGWGGDNARLGKRLSPLKSSPDAFVDD